MKVAATIRDEIINSFVQNRNPSLMSTVRGEKTKTINVFPWISPLIGSL